jgi:hypothetical protein
MAQPTVPVRDRGSSGRGLSGVFTWRSLFTEQAHRDQKEAARFRLRQSHCDLSDMVFAAPSRSGTSGEARGKNGYNCDRVDGTASTGGEAALAGCNCDHDSGVDFGSAPIQTAGRRIPLHRPEGLSTGVPVRGDGRRPAAHEAEAIATPERAHRKILSDGTRRGKETQRRTRCEMPDPLMPRAARRRLNSPRSPGTHVHKSDVGEWAFSP